MISRRGFICLLGAPAIVRASSLMSIVPYGMDEREFYRTIVIPIIERHQNVTGEMHGAVGPFPNPQSPLFSKTGTVHFKPYSEHGPGQIIGTSRRVGNRVLYYA